VRKRAKKGGKKRDVLDVTDKFEIWTSQRRW
jgi:hypothetical protein